MFYLARMTAIMLFLFLLQMNAFSATSDRVRVIDGDSIDISGQRIRLHGIDTPEAKQECERDGVTWLCGAAATQALKELIGNFDVSCVQRDKDRYGRVVAVCYASGIDLNAAMVQSGMALAYRKYSDDYTGPQASAKAARRGLWAGQFVSPWDRRRGKRAVTHASVVGIPAENLQDAHATAK
jgi:endonuclease YncB( thermonuclease family)